MAASNNRKNSKNHVSALIIALGVTGLVVITMLGIGINALFNNNVSTVQAAAAPQTVDINSLTIDELKDLVTQYQGREAQYQNELAKAADQVNTANAQIEQYKALLNDLQNAGVIQIDRNGNVTVLANSVPAGNHEHEENERFWEHDD